MDYSPPFPVLHPFPSLSPHSLSPSSLPTFVLVPIFHTTFPNTHGFRQGQQ